MKAAVQNIMIENIDDYLQTVNIISAVQKKALKAIVGCRKSKTNGHYYFCSDCNHHEFVPHSCNNRHCTTCGIGKKDDWVRNQNSKLLFCTYFHLVFTLPHSLHGVIKGNQAIMYKVFFDVVAATLKEFTKNESKLGGQAGFTAVLHTWKNDLGYHPHIHVLMPAMSLTKDGVYRDMSGEKYLFNVGALSKVFRAKFVDLTRKELPGVKLPEKIWAKAWNVYCKPIVKCGPEDVVAYLGRYINRTAINDNRIISFDSEKVVFANKDKTKGPITLPIKEFI